MVSSKLTRLVSLVGVATLPLTAVVAVLSASMASAQIPLPENEGAPSGDMQDLRPLAQDGTILSVRGGQRLLSDAGSAVSAGNYDLALNKLQEARQLFNQLSNFHQELASSFSGIDNRIADNQRRQAVETAQMRDQATYQLALVYRTQNQPELAVPLLIQIIRSQQPTRSLGQQAYRQLFELGFVDSPYPRGQEAPPSPGAPQAPGMTTAPN